jgi:environmental stress-induced protein Ves
MRTIRFADLASTPWKNGGGTTTEIAVSPAGTGFGDFDWRLSIAEVASDGPFSLFPGIDRTLTLIEGNGLAMTIADAPPRTLTMASGPLSFPGDVPVSAALIAGPIRDFNVMSRRGRFAHRVLKHDLTTGPAALPAGDVRLIVSLGTGPLTFGGESVDAAFGDVIAIEHKGPAHVRGTHPILLVLIAAAE